MIKCVIDYKYEANKNLQIILKILNFEKTTFWNNNLKKQNKLAHKIISGPQKFGNTWLFLGMILTFGSDLFNFDLREKFSENFDN